MINKYIFSLALDNIGKVQRPDVNYKRCINRAQSKHDCKICRESCPGGAISQNNKKQIEIDHELCKRCYLCSGICPTQCISHNSAFIKSNDTGESTLVIGCSQSSSELIKAKVPCIASLPWEFYAYFSYKTPIAMISGNCEDCAVNAQIHIEAMKERLKLFWGKEYEHKVLDNVEDLAAGISRREFFGLLTKKIRDAKKSMDASAVEDVSDNSKNQISIFRKLLLRELDEKKAHGWLTLDLNKSCWGCKICERLCPGKALEVTKLDERWGLSHDVSCCTGCKICKTVCPEQAIQELVEHHVRSKNHVVFNSIKAKSCEVCGQSIKQTADDICNLCKSKARRKKAAG